MKEIKFRAWDSETETFIYSDKEYDEAWFSFQDGILRAYAIHGMDAGSLDKPPQPNCEKLEKPQQFTGLHDKYKKEIYEGDVVIGETSYEKINDERQWTQQKPAIVKWNNEICGFFPFYLNARWRCDVVNLEIIGNIYENAELLKAHNGDKT